MKGTKVAIYCRLSKEDEERAGVDSESIQNQRLLLTEYALNQNWDIIRVYVDDDYSGLDRERPDFKKMIADAEIGLFDIILCKTQSRFTRDMELVEKYLHNLFVIWGIRFVSVIDNVDTSVSGNKKSRQIFGLVNEWYCEDLSENIRAVFRRKMKDGQFLGSFAPYGYMKDPLDHHRLVVDDEAAIVVTEIFNQYLKGYGCAHIAQLLTAKKIPTPSSYKHKVGLKFSNPYSDKFSEPYGVWAANTISRILKNQAYIGTLIQGREKKVSYKSRKVVLTSKDEWVICENNHQQIIEIDTFNKVQELMANRRTIHKPKNDGVMQAHVLAGKVRCLDCGTNMNRSAKARNGENYLKCRLAVKTLKQSCTYHTVKLERLIEVVEGKIRALVQKFISEQAEEDFINEFFEQDNSTKNEIAVLQKEHKKISDKIEEAAKNLTSVYLDKQKGIIDENEFISIKRYMNAETEKDCERQKIIEGEIESLTLKVKSLKDIGKVLKSCANFDKLTHEIVNNFVDYIEIGEKSSSGEQIINIHWLF